MKRLIGETEAGFEAKDSAKNGMEMFERRCNGRVALDGYDADGQSRFLNESFPCQARGGGGGFFSPCVNTVRIVYAGEKNYFVASLGSVRAIPGHRKNIIRYYYGGRNEFTTAFNTVGCTRQ